MNKENITMFIDTGNMEERYGEQLYTEHLEKELKKANDKLDKIKEYVKKIDEVYICKTDIVNIYNEQKLYQYSQKTREYIKKDYKEDILSIIDGDDKEC